MTSRERNEILEARFDRWMDRPWTKAGDAKRVALWVERITARGPEYLATLPVGDQIEYRNLTK